MYLILMIVSEFHLAKCFISFSIIIIWCSSMSDDVYEALLVSFHVE